MSFYTGRNQQLTGQNDMAYNILANCSSKCLREHLAVNQLKLATDIMYNMVV